MAKELYIALVTKQLSGELSIEEQEQLKTWLTASSDNQREYELLEADWALSARAKKTIEVDAHQDFMILKNRIQKAKSDVGVGKKGETEKSEKSKVVPLRNSSYRWISIAASILVVVAAWFLFSTDQSSKQLVVVTTTGEFRTITLSDGTKVWMNENSTLNYPETFVVGSRQVNLKGEAYFEVAKNAASPFSVELREATITVLGTKFNIAENKEAISVHVDEGRVRLSENEGGEKIELTANQGATYDSATHNISKLSIYNKNSTSWKSKALIFEGVSLSEVLNDIELHFGNSVELELESMKDCTFSGYYPNPDAKTVLSNLAASFEMTLTQDSNGNYKLIGGECKTLE